MQLIAKAADMPVQFQRFPPLGWSPSGKRPADLPDTKSIEMLLAANADPDSTGRNTVQSVAPLLLSAEAQFGKAEHIMELLLEAGAKPDKLRGSDGSFPLFVAAQDGHLERVKILLKHGANPLLKMRDGDTAYNIALHEHHDETAKCIDTATAAAI